MSTFLNAPNILSVMRILLVPVFVFLFFGGPLMQLFSVIVFTIAAITDAYDGYLARKLKIATKFGAFIDPMADKALILSVFSVFAYIKFIGWWVVIAFLVRDLFITLLRMRLISVGPGLQTSKMAKNKTVLQFVAVYLLFLNLFLHNLGCQALVFDYFVKLFVYAVVIFSVYTALDYVKVK
jgi:CDP-diacylglycerol--glycerol-3-phosphate 3-phosphatidyltransferase